MTEDTIDPELTQEDDPEPWTNAPPVVIKRLVDRVPGESWVQLAYGQSGSGKTFYCGTAGANSLFLNTGQGIATLMSPLFRKAVPDAGQMIVVDIAEQMDEKGVVKQAAAWDLISSTIDYFLANHRDKFDVVILDDATFMRRFAMNKAMELNTAARKSTTGRVDAVSAFMKPDVGDYGMEMQMIEWFLAVYIQKFKSANIHFLMTAHERNIYRKPPQIGDEPVLVKTLPGFTGKTFPDQAILYFDDVFHTEVVGGIGNTHYRLRTAGSEALRCKPRHGGIFPSVVQNPNFRNMLAEIRKNELHSSYRR